MTEYVYLRSSSTSWYNGIGDFANIFKAFIGTNYLSLAYGFKQSGLGFGLAGLVLISLLTGYCCQLIVICKHIVIDDLCKQHSEGEAWEDGGQSEDGDVSGGGARGDDGRGRGARGGASGDDSDKSSMFRLHLQANLDYTDLGRLTFGRWGAFLVSTCLVITQLGFCVGYFVFIGNAFDSLVAPAPIAPPAPPLNVTSRLSMVMAPGLSPDDSPLPPESSSLALLVLAPFPLLAAFTMFRDVRQMAPLSIMANIVILGGLLGVLFYVISDFHISPTVVWMRWATLPVFFGQMTSAYEAIGVIIPIEASMHGGKRRFPLCLCSAMSLFTLLLSALAVCGYMRYGDDTRQIIAQNLNTDRSMTILINLTLIFGVMCTYPLQIFPVVEILEGLMFTHGRPCGPAVKDDTEKLELSRSDDEADEKHGLLAPKEPHFRLPVASFVPKSVASWKRNLFRCLLTALVALIAALLRNVFAYVGALVGAIGSCPLAFVLPCLFHLRLRRHQMSRLSVGCHVVIVVVGVAASLISFVVVLMEIISRA